MKIEGRKIISGNEEMLMIQWNISVSLIIVFYECLDIALKYFHIKFTHANFTCHVLHCSSQKIPTVEWKSRSGAAQSKNRFRPCPTYVVAVFSTFKVAHI